MAVHTMSIEQFQRLFSVISPEQRESFITTSMSYNGSRKKEVLNTFLTALTVYKNLDKVSDEELLQKLSNLLKAEASKWWNEVKNQVKTWSDFQVRIKKQFPDKKPYEIYLEIFQRQRNDEPTEQFIARKRVLFSQLPEQHPENVQIDMLFGLLNSHIRGKLDRESFETFEGLIMAANETEKELPKIRKSVRCGYCRMRGHITDECLRRKRDMETQKNGDSDEDSPKTKVLRRDMASQIPSPYDPKSDMLS